MLKNSAVGLAGQKQSSELRADRPGKARRNADMNQDRRRSIAIRVERKSQVKSNPVERKNQAEVSNENARSKAKATAIQLNEKATARA
ncbi:MAG: hypothetical protein Q8O52_17085 [Sulfuritalea sp.]|nr:hypothetical protein [Sulfuritalea sp.]